MDPAYFGLTNTKSLNLTTAADTHNYTESIPSGSLSRYSIYNSYGQLTKLIYECGKKKKVLSNIKKVIFNNPATIVLWRDGTKTIVKCGENETFDEEKGLAMAIAKYALGNEGVYYEVFKKWLPNDEDRNTVSHAFDSFSSYLSEKLGKQK